jgi:hypothetical protein
MTISISSGHHIKAEKDTSIESKMILQMESSCSIHLHTRRVPGWNLGTMSCGGMFADFGSSPRLLGSRGKTSQNKIRNVRTWVNHNVNAVSSATTKKLYIQFYYSSAVFLQFHIPFVTIHKLPDPITEEGKVVAESMYAPFLSLLHIAKPATT